MGMKDELGLDGGLKAQAAPVSKKSENKAELNSLPCGI